MKQKIIIIIGILAIICICFYFVFKPVTVFINLNNGNIEHVKLSGFGSIALDTDNIDKINKTLQYFKSIGYYKNRSRKEHNSSPDASLILLNKDGKVIDRLEFFGNLAEYQGMQYKIASKSVYDELEKLCKSLN